MDRFNYIYGRLKFKYPKTFDIIDNFTVLEWIVIMVFVIMIFFRRYVI